MHDLKPLRVEVQNLGGFVLSFHLPSLEFGSELLQWIDVVNFPNFRIIVKQGQCGYKLFKLTISAMAMNILKAHNVNS
jgi:hypothetical protein